MKTWISPVLGLVYMAILLPMLGFGLSGCVTGRGAAGKGGAIGCSCPCACKNSQEKPAAPVQGGQAAGAALPVVAAGDHGAVPVTVKDPTWGSPDAPVTLVEFSDFECPFCARVGTTLEELKRIYGPSQLRVVWKNFPLPFHNEARPASDAAMTVFALGGDAAFWKFHDLVFANQQDLSAVNYLRWAVLAGVDGVKFQAELAAKRNVAKVDEDMALAEGLGIRGTPVFRINGVALQGAQRIDKFTEIIETQLTAAKALMASGTPAGQVYPLLSAKNNAPAAPPAPEPEDTTIWRVPVAKSDPTRGPADALVTLVLFSDFQCPFCKRVEETLASLEQKYGSDLRIVWKDYPLPFHEWAVPAAVLARVAFAKKGVKGFWQAHDTLFEGQADLDEKTLKGIAKSLGLSWSEIHRANVDHRFADVLDESEELAKSLGVGGTPCAFVNGYRMAGALPSENFVVIVDAQLAKAKAMVDAGQARAGLYEAIAKSAKVPGATP
jgi:protein-disulfide isomerase